MGMPTTSTSDGKPWYKKPESILTYGGLAGLAYVGIQFLDSFLPILNRVLANGIYTIALGSVLAVLGFLAVNGDFHRLLWYGWKSAMRYVTGIFVQLDPIGIMLSYVDTLKANLVTIKGSIAELRGQARQLEALIKKKIHEHEQGMNMAKAARSRADQKGMRTSMKLHARRAGRAEKSSVTYQHLLNKINKHIRVMEKIEEAANFMVLDIQDTVEEETEKRNMIKSSHKSMSAAKKILAAGKDREMYDLALQATTDEYFTKLGEIEQFMEDSQHFVNTMDLENGAFEEEALAKLDAWEERSANILGGGSGKTQYRVDPVKHLTPEEEEAEEDESFSSMFNSL